MHQFGECVAAALGWRRGLDDAGGIATVRRDARAAVRSRRAISVKRGWVAGR